MAGLCVLALACGDATEERVDSALEAPLVEAVAARFGALPIEASLPGVVRARNQVIIRPEISGRIVEVLAQSGQAVERGQALVRLDESEARERLRQAEADVRLAEAAAQAAAARAAEVEARVARARVLADEELVSAQELESLEAQLDALEAGALESSARIEQARAAAEERRSALGKTTVRAPVAGRLGERRVEVGMQADPSTVLFQIGDLDQLVVELDLTETMLAKVQEDMPVEIEARTQQSEPIVATLSRISPFLAEDSFTTRGEIDVDNVSGRLRPGMFVNVRILVGESQRATLVPISALREDPASGSRGVFVVSETATLQTPAEASYESPEEPRQVRFLPVDVLAEGRGAAGIRGVDEGAWVVTVGHHLLAAELRATRTGGEPTGAADEPRLTARVRAVPWERVLELQNLQNEDLLEGFLDKQRKLAAALGSEIPESEEVVNRVLEQTAPADSGGA